MQVELIYSTPHYPKLSECIARQCYDSYSKTSETSHKFIKAIMKKGHLSVLSCGNLVFQISYLDWNTVPYDILTMREINNYIRSTNSTHKDDSQQDHIIVSMNMLSFLDVLKFKDEYTWHTVLFEKMIEEVLKIKELAWFFTDIKLEPSENEYVKMGRPTWYQPILLTEDYTTLKSLGLSNYELNIHSTATVNFMTDRSIGLQSSRHTDTLGMSETSQRYVDRRNATYRIPEVDDIDIINKIGLKIQSIIHDYSEITDELIGLGMNHGRAKEIARAILPNGISTSITQCRNLNAWKHFFDLRVSKHSQLEMEKDAKSIKDLFVKNNITV